MRVRKVSRNIFTNVPPSLDELAQYTVASEKSRLVERIQQSFFLRCSLTLCSTFALVHIFLYRANPLISLPIATDDYSNLGWSFNHFWWSSLRPVSCFLVSLFSALGNKTFFVAMLCSTLSYVALVFTFVGELFQTKRVSGALLLLASTVIVSFEYFVQYYKATGIIVGIAAGNFAVLAMLLALRASNKKTFSVWSLVAIGLCVTLSIFAKEEFALPLIIFFAWCTVKTISIESRKYLTILIAFSVLTSVACIILQRMDNSCFTGNAGEYRCSLDLRSLSKCAVFYLTNCPGALLALALQGMALSVIPFVADRSIREKILLISVLWASVMLPFLTLSSHLYAFYGLDWMPWQCASIFALASVFAESLKSKVIQWGAVLVLLPIVVLVTDVGRRSLLNYYKTEESYARNVALTLKNNQEALNTYPVVGVLGARISSPWCCVRSDYLRAKMNIKPNWRVFADRQSSLYQLVHLRYGQYETDNVRIFGLDELQHKSDAPLLSLDQNGNGSLAVPSSRLAK